MGQNGDFAECFGRFGGGDPDAGEAGRDVFLKCGGQRHRAFLVNLGEKGKGLVLGPGSERGEGFCAEGLVVLGGLLFRKDLAECRLEKPGDSFAGTPQKAVRGEFDPAFWRDEDFDRSGRF